MKAEFFEYHTPSPEEFEKLWREAVYSFDANVLLDLYRFSTESRDELLKLFRFRRDRIWLTFQSASEFHQNRLQVIGEAGKRASELKALLTRLKTLTTDDLKQHPFVTSSLCEKVGKFCDDAIRELQSSEQGYPNLLRDDPIARELLAIFDGRVGKPYDPNRLAEIEPVIIDRYDKQIPPGYQDRKTKDQPRSFGDCIIWFQLIEFAKEKKCPLIFVTGDSKDDWWLREGGKTLMPRPELRREFRESTDGQDFYLYQTPNFIEQAKRYQQNHISDRLLEESRAIATEPRSDGEKENTTPPSLGPLISWKITGDNRTRDDLAEAVRLSIEKALRAHRPLKPKVIGSMGENAPVKEDNSSNSNAEDGTKKLKIDESSENDQRGN